MPGAFSAWFGRGRVYHVPGRFALFKWGAFTPGGAFTSIIMVPAYKFY